MAFGSFIGLYFSLGSIMSSLFYPIGFSPKDVATIGLIMLASGVVGAALTGGCLDKTGAYKKTILLYIGCSMILFALLAMELLG